MPKSGAMTQWVPRLSRPEAAIVLPRRLAAADRPTSTCRETATLIRVASIFPLLICPLLLRPASSRPPSPAPLDQFTMMATCSPNSTPNSAPMCRAASRLWARNAAAGPRSTSNNFPEERNSSRHTGTLNCPKRKYTRLLNFSLASASFRRGLLSRTSICNLPVIHLLILALIFKRPRRIRNP